VSHENTTFSVDGDYAFEIVPNDRLLNINAPAVIA
jgi:hypothetical protein